MNKTFREYATSQAFGIALSHRQVATLLALEARDEAFSERDGRFVPTARCLIRRGLIEHVESSGLPRSLSDAYPLTDAGRMMCGLLREAGFKHRMQLRAVA